MKRFIKYRDSEETVPVGKVICLGRNYVAHAQELGNEVPDEPAIFLKPDSCIIQEGEDIVLPPSSQNVHEEVELGVVIGFPGKDIPQERAHEHVEGYLVFLDITARDIQNKLKEKRLSWAWAKGYDTFGPISPMVRKEAIPDPQDLSLKLWINDELKQDGTTSLMIFKIDFLISYLSTIMTLEPGDIIATGTPKGVSQIVAGDTLRAAIEGVGDVEFKVR